MTKPITPNEVVKLKKTIIPDYVIEVFNTLIAKHWNGHSSVVSQREAINAICIAIGKNTDNLRYIHRDLENEIFSNNYLDVEDIYRQAGWKVVYDKPGYNEDYPATFKFSK